MYKVKNGLFASSSVSELFQLKESACSLRNNDLNVPRFSIIRYGKHSLRCQGLLMWSKLSSDLRELLTLELFWTNIRKIDLASEMQNNLKRFSLCRS